MFVGFAFGQVVPPAVLALRSLELAALVANFYNRRVSKTGRTPAYI